MSHPPPPAPRAPAAKPAISRNTVILVVLSLLLCCGLPILPIYLWRTGKLPVWAGIGLAISWIAFYAVVAITAPAPEPEVKRAEPRNPTPSAKTSTRAAPTRSAKPVATTDPDPDADRKALVARAEKLVLEDLPDVPAWKGVSAKGIYVSATQVCVDRTYGPSGGVAGAGGNAGYVVVTFPGGELDEPQDGTCSREGSAPKATPNEIDVPAGIKDDRGLLVSSDYGDEWPLAVTYGRVRCGASRTVTFIDPDGKIWAVNGTAQDLTDYPELDPIWADDPELPGAKINIAPVLDRGLELCD